jgi:hypothetical protein
LHCGAVASRARARAGILGPPSLPSTAPPALHILGPLESWYSILGLRLPGSPWSAVPSHPGSLPVKSLKSLKSLDLILASMKQAVAPFRAQAPLAQTQRSRTHPHTLTSRSHSLASPNSIHTSTCRQARPIVGVSPSHPHPHFSRRATLQAAQVQQATKRPPACTRWRDVCLDGSGERGRGRQGPLPTTAASPSLSHAISIVHRPLPIFNPILFLLLCIAAGSFWAQNPKGPHRSLRMLAILEKSLFPYPGVACLRPSSD